MPTWLQVVNLIVACAALVLVLSTIALNVERRHEDEQFDTYQQAQTLVLFSVVQYIVEAIEHQQISGVFNRSIACLAGLDERSTMPAYQACIDAAETRFAIIPLTNR